ncbi:MAG: hypothetical protein WB502_08820 [Thermoactinomyces sp.]
MAKKLVALLLVSGLLLVLPEAAKAEKTEQTTLKMEELTVQILPEYSYHPKDKKNNHPPLLIGYHGSLRNTTGQPQKGKIRIPLPVHDKNFRIGFAGDYSNDLKEMYEIEYELDKKTGTITWETSEEIEPQGTYKFVVEYYTDSIQIDKNKQSEKSLKYSFKNFTDIGFVNFVFVEPLDTEKFVLKPSAQSHQENSFGMNMFVYTEQKMKAGDKKDFLLEYVRNEKRTSAEILEEMAGGPPKEAAAVKNEEKMPFMTILLVVGGISAVAATGLLIFLRKRSKKADVENHAQDNRQDLKKARLRTMLLDGSITEEEYQELLKRTEGEQNVEK